MTRAFRIALLTALLALPPFALSGAGAAPVPRQITIVTMHLDGNANIHGDAAHPPEQPPEARLPAGGGIIRSEPDASGAWRMRVFLFVPSQIVAREGETLMLHFAGVQGPRHRIALDGHDSVIELQRGEIESVRWSAATPGVYRYVSLGREPSMAGSILVLPRDGSAERVRHRAGDAPLAR